MIPPSIAEQLPRQSSRLSIELSDERGRDHSPRHSSRQNSSESTVRRARDSSASRVVADPKKRYSRNHDLLQTAINQNHHFKSNLTRSASTHSMSNKNIPMTDTKNGTDRPALRKWHSYQMNPEPVHKNTASARSGSSGASAHHSEKNSAHPESRIIVAPSKQAPQDQNSISPLTVLKDQYNIKRPASHRTLPTTPTTDNSFGNLMDQSSRTHSDVSTVTDSRPSKTVLKRMSNIMNMAHSSMHSLVPSVLGVDNDNESLSGRVSSGNISNYQSESDSEEEENTSPKGNSKDKPNAWKSIDTSQIDLSASLDNFQEIINEISEFQDNFVDKFNSNQAKVSRSSRTQQKVLDYKDLYSFDSSTTLSSMTPFSSATSAHVQTSSVMNSYATRIQNETISSQYTSIRLRFGSKAEAPLSSMKKHIGTNTAVLGYINRSEYVKRSGNSWNSGIVSHAEKTPIDIDSKDDIIKNMWDTEINQLFGTPHEAMVTDLGGTGTMDDEEYTGVDFSAMARGVKLLG